MKTKTGATLGVVLKRFTRADHSNVLLEWDRLSFARALALPAPDPVALDADGRWFGAPAIVMRRLQGRPQVSPSKLQPWLEQIAAAMVTIQGVSAKGGPAAVRRPHKAEQWEPPVGLRRTALVKDAIEVIEQQLPLALKGERAFGHGDFHPGNLVWSRDRLSGVVDWSAARVGPRAHEVAYCRADLTVLMGADVADQFLQAYERAWGSPLGEDLWVWDLVCALDAMRFGYLWVIAYREQGKTDLTSSNVWPRAAGLVRRALRHT
ncbi:MAG: phosphotransferase family protein [Actinomycetota bacterium]